ncbi:TPA: hypothetical protein ACH3X2_010874 [Trebouxia sp. C0005]
MLITCAGKPAHHPHKCPKQQFPWRPTFTDHIKEFLLCFEFRSAVQLTVGQLAVSLFVFINRLNYTNGCLSSIFYVAAVVLVAQDSHVGSKMNAAAFVIGPLWFGSIIAGCMITIARACQVAFTGLLCLFIVIGLFPICLLRATMGPGVGIFSNLGFGITIIQGQFSWAPQHGYQLLWKDAVGHVLLDGLIAALGTAVGGLVVLPTLASHSLRREVAEILMEVGHSLSGYATHMFEKSDLVPAEAASVGPVADDPASKDMSSRILSRHDSRLTAMMDDQPEEDYWDVMQQATDPAADHMPRHLACAQSVAVASLRPMIAHSRALIGEAEKEPPFIGRHRVLLSEWRPALRALEALITKVAALESLLEGRGESLLHDGRLQEVLGHDVLPVMRLLHAHMAAACAHLAKLLRAHRGHQKGHYRSVFGPSWSALEHELAYTLHTTVQGYWTRWKATHHTGFSLPSPQVRALLYTSTLTNAIMEAMASVEAAVMHALAHQTTLYPRPPAPNFADYHQQIARASQPVHEALSMSGFSGRQWNQEHQPDQDWPVSRKLSKIPSGNLPEEAGDKAAAVKAPSRKSFGDVTRSARRLLPVSFRQRPLQQQQPADQPNLPTHHAKPTGLQSAPQMRAWLWNEVAWVEPLLRTMLAQMCFQNLWLTLTQTIPQTCRSKALLVDTIRHGRKFQFFCKYYLAMCGSLCGCVILSQDVSAIRQWSPLYVMITVIVVMSEKVDTTITKGALRLVGTGIGGVLGFLVMLRTGLATSPVALAAIICVYTWLFGLASQTQYKYAVFLTLITADAVILCQYSPVPGSHGNPKYFYARCASIAVGVVVVLLIGLILPWFTYTDAMDTLGDAYKEATQLMLKFYVTFYDDVKDSDENSGGAQQRATSVSGLLEQKIAAPVVRVQTALAKETVLWKKGILAMPQVVRETLRAMQVLLDRLSALQMMLLQKPVVSGHYTSAPYHNMLQPLDQYVRAVLESAVRLGVLTAELLSEQCTDACLDAVQAQIKQLEALRVQLRKNYIRISHQYHLEVKSQSSKPQIKNRTVDDAVRYLSFLFAASNAIDKATLLAKTVCANEWVQTRCHNKLKANLQAWLGL